MEVGHCPGCQVMEVLCCLKIFYLEFFLLMCDFTCDIFVYLKFPFLSLLWRDVPYPSRPCSSATKPLKLFLLGINKSHLFCSPELLSFFITHCLPACLSAFPTCDLLEQIDGLYLTHFRSSLAKAAHSPSYFSK